MAIDQLEDARLEPTAADRTDLQAEPAQYAADPALNVEQLGLDDVLLTTNEAAAYLNSPPQTLIYWRRVNYGLPYYRTGVSGIGGATY